MNCTLQAAFAKAGAISNMSGVGNEGEERFSNRDNVLSRFKVGEVIFEPKFTSSK